MEYLLAGGCIVVVLIDIVVAEKEAFVLVDCIVAVLAFVVALAFVELVFVVELEYVELVFAVEFAAVALVFVELVGQTAPVRIALFARLDSVVGLIVAFERDYSSEFEDVVGDTEIVESSRWLALR